MAAPHHPEKLLSRCALKLPCQQGGQETQLLGRALAGCASGCGTCWADFAVSCCCMPSCQQQLLRLQQALLPVLRLLSRRRRRCAPPALPQCRGRGGGQSSAGESLQKWRWIAGCSHSARCSQLYVENSACSARALFLSRIRLESAGRAAFSSEGAFLLPSCRLCTVAVHNHGAATRTAGSRRVAPSAQWAGRQAEVSSTAVPALTLDCL